MMRGSLTRDDLLRNTLAYQRGRTASLDGIRRGHNPYAEQGAQIESSAWWLGWDDEQEREPDRFKDEQLSG